MPSPRPHDPDRLQRRRIAAGLTRAALARRAGISPSHMSMIENGSANPSPPVLSRLAGVLRCRIADLMPLQPDSEQTPESPAGAA